MDIQPDHERTASIAWAIAVAKVRKKQAELQERQVELREQAKKAERDRAFCRIWGDPVSRSRAAPPSKPFTTVAT
jgi:hypothetical protein